VDSAAQPLPDHAALRRQDHAAFAAVVRAHQNTILGLAESLGLRGPDADDAAAEAFVQVYRALPNFRGDAALATWVYRIAYRTILRQRHRRPRAAEAIAENLPASEPPVTESAAQKEQFQLLWRAVEKLEPRQASAIELFYRRELSIEEIAQIMDCPTGTIKTLLFRGRKKLQEILTPPP
jgi:RNA polymerase sigma-70 factor (ECF subfamily)